MLLSDMSDSEWREAILRLELPEWLRDWSLTQINRSQAYYIKRIKQIGLSGRAVLDAGCGMGNWSMALARFYDHVLSLDIEQPRLMVLSSIIDRFRDRIQPIHGSLEQMPFPDDHFDTIFCNGVIFLTDYRKTLDEFCRVLRKGGNLYLTYNSLEWWKHLLLDRGPNEPECIIYGANGIIHYLWQLLDRVNFEKHISKSNRCRALDFFFPNQKWRRILLWFCTKYALPSVKSKYLKNCEFEANFGDIMEVLLTTVLSDVQSTNLNNNAAFDRIIQCFNLIKNNCPLDYLERVFVDLYSRFMTQMPSYQIKVETHCFSPEEMTSELEKRGFYNILTAHEGCLHENFFENHVESIYHMRMGVYETLAFYA